MEKARSVETYSSMGAQKSLAGGAGMHSQVCVCERAHIVCCMCTCMSVCPSVWSYFTYIPGLCGVKGESVVTPAQGRGGISRRTWHAAPFSCLPRAHRPTGHTERTAVFHMFISRQQGKGLLDQGMLTPPKLSAPGPHSIAALRLCR